MSSLSSILLDPKYHDILSIIKGARNGFVYGCKIRFPHALVMTLLFSNRPWPAKIKAIYTATLTHAKNLAKFVTVYKVLLILQRRIRDGAGVGAGESGGKVRGEKGLDTFVAGLIGGWWVFGERTAINEQIVLYVSSRVLASFLPRLLSSSTPSIPLNHAPTSSTFTLRTTISSYLPSNLQPLSPLPPLTSRAANPKPIPPADTPFALFAALSWGLVMYVYRNRGERLQPGMVNSMSYLYRDSEWWDGLKTLVWHNK